ncbi:Ectoine hydroxylase-related dioxygenase, phytanoyl-CoA dioxygenase (PhyH) family [Streptosporangium canum]|uniref:Ectoine hydroxylase-related dioxygenase, phytanoyl-CoA dioxygenase (PhyH) family n=1 Tax=Streptosporangium canum TaxID=324952 RepID=A0A1I3N148_9ACTN|nr:phytanoyl-CoA dioxygenase family protein [Streptosporangium canum]SFJ02922.1 Ectoine hydroxylase-related dioxygenase, phytanoyl-CoA dioxygenase (PhyH) family [Streptosporangium canum]
MSTGLLPFSRERIVELHDEYDRDGSVVVGQILSGDEVQECRSQIDRYIKQVIPALPQSVIDKTVRYEEDGEAIRSCYFMDQVDPWFRKFGNRADLKALVAGVAGYEPELYVVETFNKYAEVGSSAVPHQDAIFLPIEPIDMVHLWIAIDPATEQNGALEYWNGTHKQGLVPHEPAPFGLIVTGWDIHSQRELVKTAVLEPGGAAIHSGTVIHYSPPNPTTQPRLGLLCGYRGAHTRVLEEE